MIAAESPIVFECAGERLVGILHPGQRDNKTGVVIVVGGPQYRVGSHRQFVLMARMIAAAGYPVLRFDYRGMGDSEGMPRTFEEIGEDIRSAVNGLLCASPEIKRVVLLGLCDAASALLIHSTDSQHVAGLVLINPWVRTVQGEARSYLRHYYFQRIFQRSFWRKVLSGEFDLIKSVSGFLESLRTIGCAREGTGDAPAGTSSSFIEKMKTGFQAFNRHTLVLISGRDLTAAEFVDLCARDKGWKAAISSENVAFVKLPEADHTFSQRNDLNTAADQVLAWLKCNH